LQPILVECALEHARVRYSVIFVLGLFLLTAVTTTPAAPAERMPMAPVDRTPVFLHTNARDVVGATYVDRLREALAGSSAYRAVMHPVSAQFVVGIVTMDPSGAETGAGAGRSTVAAVTLQRQQPTGHNQFIYSWVLMARPDTVDSLAAELLTAIDQQIRELNPSAGPDRIERFEPLSN
jgi:hypothetical protein